MSQLPDKTQLRHRMRTIRAEAAARDPDAAEKLADLFPMKLLDRYGPVVAGYVAINEEIDPKPLMERLMRAGAELCLPRIEDDGRMTWRLWTPGEPLERRPFGLSEPANDAPEAHPTLVLTPLLAFDGMGNRLGYGKGHYDTALTSLRSEGRAFACALAFAAQQIDSVPAEPHDQPLDWAVTPIGSVPLFMMRNMKALNAADGDGPDAA
ncbi:5-formyltetrahydrofolate cyclo-ligase [Hyphomonas johnsonii]|uniref:5-formyltetrahydrofolate cyclo-ligase n=1 Tax=Hyphomonas johnsonii MHS-2 TaxID=1280950 RepID=A0A059FV40_9PROT|nr:5-formyltetrahydrofolate cyclo-ligase [Hyphomonas johnsonii]KCZ94535.1 5-formyltetrahydrofolate cyclo-ligase [Hyphomonas johnsonii MHS-2]